MVQSLYDVLGAHTAASAEQLKEAYKQALLASHPDKQQSDASLFHSVQLAWQVLGDPKRRIIYDAQQRSATVDRAIVDDEITMLEMSPVRDSDEDFLEYQCRCGDMYVVGLDELLASCEVLVQCRSCSNHVLVRAKE